MLEKDLLDWFPEAKISNQPLDKPGFLSIPLSFHQWLLLDEEKLSEREKQLVTLLTGNEKVTSLNPWYAYLIEGKTQAPRSFKKIQLIHCHLSHFQAENIAPWLEMMQTLFSNCQSVLQVGSQDYLFVLSQDKYHSIRELLVDMIEAVEYDFNLRMAVMVGQIWSLESPQTMATLVGAERKLFKAYWRKGHHGVYRFSDLYLRELGKMVEALRPIHDYLYRLIQSQEQLQEIVLSLWKNSAVLTKAAQQLYLHRNSLQYKIDKWEELTGLQLKELTDLTVCYHLIVTEGLS